VVRDPVLLLLEAADIRTVLEGSPDPFAPDPAPKRKGMGHFQPEALTISRGAEWHSRRAFAEATLGTGATHHRLAERFTAVAREEADALLREAGAELTWDPWHLAFRRITRRIVLGDAARDDEALTDLLAAMMDSANGMPDEPHERVGEFVARIAEYLAAAEPASLAAEAGSAPVDAATAAEHQLTHWLFASGDTLPANAFRALALLATHPEECAHARADEAHLDACLSEAMRLWPTTPLLSRVTLAETELGGEAVPAGTQVLISNLLGHRDRQAVAGADRFDPVRWTEGDAASDWRFNHFSRGAQGCPGSSLAMQAGRAVLTHVLAGHEPECTGGAGALAEGRTMPHMLDFFALRFRLSQ
jgi:cytochrome P450